MYFLTLLPVVILWMFGSLLPACERIGVSTSMTFLSAKNKRISLSRTALASTASRDAPGRHLVPGLRSICMMIVGFGSDDPELEVYGPECHRLLFEICHR